MKVSELISQLQEIFDHQGDLGVLVAADYGYFDIEESGVETREKGLVVVLE